MDQMVVKVTLAAGVFGGVLCALAPAHAQAPALQPLPASSFALDEVPLPAPVSGRDFGEGAQATGGFAPTDTVDIPHVDPAEFSRRSPPSPPQDAARPAVAAEASPTTSPTSSPVAASLAALLAQRGPAATPAAAAELTALSAFYAARGHAPLWVGDRGLNVRAIAAIARIKAAGQDGLDPDAYVIPNPTLATGGLQSPDDLARAELAVSRATLLYAKQAQSGRVVPRSLSPLMTADPPVPDRLAVLQTLADARDVAAALDAFNPPHPGFQALRAKLAALSAEQRPDEVALIVPSGPVLRPGNSDPRVPLLRDRLKLPASYSTEYGLDLLVAVQAFQRTQGLSSSGVIGPQTIDALNEAGRGGPTADIIANMERWRWLPRDLGATHVFVNIPDYELKIVRNGAESYRTRVVVGKATNQTPIFSNAIQFVVVNPYWHVPSSIAVKEMLPNLRNDPGYLARQGIEVVSISGKKAEVVSPYSIDWTTTNMNKLQFRQLPGERNALGRIKFMFPNEHSVYLHDTPSRSLFARDMRALSHGCVRVDMPLQFGEALLSQEGMTAKKLGALVGGAERRVGIKTAIPVHLVYFTETVDGTGTLRRRPDIYGHDKVLKRALGLAGITTAAQ